MSQRAQGLASMKGQELTRPRLHALLDTALHNTLCVVAAGAGYGKTREVSAYLASREHSVIWLQLTDLDNLQRYFWRSFTRAVASYDAKLANKLMGQGFPDSPQAYQSFLQVLSKAFYAQDLPIVFVFDDLHLIENIRIKNFISTFLSAKLESVSIILITRYWPVLERELHEPYDILSADQLQFTLEESLSLFRLNGLSVVAEEEIAKLHEYASGWPIALSMLVLAHKNRRVPSGDNILKASKLSLFWLFEQEIFSQYAPDAQKLLILLSVLDSFPRGLVAAITSAKNRNVFELLGNNPFIRYDVDSSRFYFQPLFLEYLREKLLSLGAEDIEAVYRAAGDWCFANGHKYNALIYYKQCGSHEAVWNVVKSIDATRYPKREAELLIDTLQWLPEDFRKDHPMTSIALSVLYANNLQFDAALETIDETMARLAERMPERERRYLLGEAYIAKGLIYHAMEKDSFIGCFREAASYLPEGSRRWNKKLKMVELGPAIRLDSTEPGALARSLEGFVTSAPHIARIFHGAGKGLDALVHCEACFLTDDIPCALEHAHRAIYEALSAEQLDIVANALFMLLKIHKLRGDYLKIQETLNSISRFEQDPSARALGMGDLSRSWFYAQMGDFNRLAEWVASNPSRHYAPVSMGRELLVRARCLIAKEEHVQALSLLDAHESFLEKKKSYVMLLYIYICKTIVHKQLGDQKTAYERLHRAYDIAEGNKIITPFIEYGNYLRPMLARAQDESERPFPQDWLHQMQSRCNTFSKRHAYIINRYKSDTGGGEGRFELSKRETELLKNLSQGLTRKEISESMGISLNTVKTILRQIYNKLGAINSADAIRIALNAGII